MPPRSDVDLLVIDPDDGAAPLSSTAVAALRQRPGAPDRTVLAYLSVGEAERFRFYWQTSWSRKRPSFLCAANPDWPGDYKVRYWDPAWQAILVGYLDRLVTAGFDGVYLDVVDGYEYFAQGGPRAERRDAALQMAELVERLAAHARLRRTDFRVVPQNGASILDALADRDQARYLDAVDAIGAESTFFFGPRRENNRLHVQKDVLRHLERFRDAGKPVLAVEYVTGRDRRRVFAGLARQHRFVPLIAPRALDHVVP